MLGNANPNLATSYMKQKPVEVTKSSEIKEYLTNPLAIKGLCKPKVDFESVYDLSLKLCKPSSPEVIF